MKEQRRKEALLAMFHAGVDAVGGYQATMRALADKDFASPVHIVVLGKAADAMARGALAILGDKIESGLVITKHDHLGDQLRATPRLECIEAGHPVPDEHSLRAGARLHDFVQALPENAQLIFLVSGGTSALVEHLDNGLTLNDLKEATDQMLASGAPIGEMNRQRRQMSMIKGGKLARAVSCNVLQLLISDVPGDVPGDIGSGLLIPDAATDMHENLAVWQQIQTQIIASSSLAQAAVVASAAEQGLSVQQPSGSLDGDVHDVHASIKNTLLNAQPGVYVWGGEPTVVLPQSPGRGGRNQHLALMLAEVAAAKGNVSILVCGTDGTDGPTHDAGGLVDERSMHNAQSQSIDIEHYLHVADAGTALETLDLLVTTGPTGTNVMDLCIALVE